MVYLFGLHSPFLVIDRNFQIKKHCRPKYETKNKVYMWAWKKAHKISEDVSDH